MEICRRLVAVYGENVKAATQKVRCACVAPFAHGICMVCG